MTSPAVQALIEHLKNEYKVEPRRGTNDGREWFTVKPENEERCYVSLTDEFLEDYPVHKKEFRQILAALKPALAESKTKAIMVTTTGLKEWSRPETLQQSENASQNLD
jgi:hypothetical protein